MNCSNCGTLMYVSPQAKETLTPPMPFFIDGKKVEALRTEVTVHRCMSCGSEHVVNNWTGV